MTSDEKTNIRMHFQDFQILTPEKLQSQNT